MNKIDVIPGFKHSSELCDVLTTVIHCPDDKTYLIGVDPAVQYYIPHTKLKTGTWCSAIKTTVQKFIDVPEVHDDKFWRILRVWKSDADDALLNVVFEVPISLEMKKNCRIIQNKKGQERAVWMKVQEVYQIKTSTCVYSSEMSTYIPVVRDKVTQLDPYRSTAFVHGNALIEVTKELVTIDKRSPTNIYDNLLDFVPELNEQSQAVLFKEFLTFTFPNVLMGYKCLERFATVLGWREDLYKVIWRGTDADYRSGISFKELLYLICVVEPGKASTGSSAEARCRYIFRCYDVNKDNKLSPAEFKEMVEAIRTARGGNNKSSVDSEIEKSLKEMELLPGSDIPLLTFLRCVGTSKFRGTTTILKADRSIMDYLTQIKKSCLTLATISSQHFLQTEEYTKFNLKPNLKLGSKYGFSSHVIKVSRSGVKEITDIQKVAGTWSTPIPRFPLTSPSSTDLFDMKQIHNEVLTSLSHFANRFTHDSKGKPAKDPFTWGPAEFYGFIRLTLQLSEHAKRIFDSEPRLLKIQSPVYIFGDVHGNFRDIICFESQFWSLGLHLMPCNLLFLGDYVDRGPFGIEIVAFLFAHKIRAPKQVFLVRGNHEIRDVQKNFTFYNECVKRCGTDLGQELWNMINNAFDSMPIAAIVDNKLFCCHGGIPPPWLCPTVSIINKIPCPLPKPAENALAWDILWNDPVREKQMSQALATEMSTNEGFAVNKRRGTAHVFNAAALQKFLSANDLFFVVRAHEVQKVGYQIHHECKMLTVFSSSHYNGGNNEAACILANGTKLRIIRIDTEEFHRDD